MTYESPVIDALRYLGAGGLFKDAPYCIIIRNSTLRNELQAQNSC